MVLQEGQRVGGYQTLNEQLFDAGHSGLETRVVVAGDFVLYVVTAVVDEVVGSVGATDQGSVQDLGVGARRVKLVPSAGGRQIWT